MSDLSQQQPSLSRRRSGRALGAVCAQVSQAGASLVLQLLAAHALGIAGFGAFAILYGVIVLLTGFVTGFVGDSLTVLDRSDRRIRSALQGWLLVLSFSAALGGGFILALTGLITVGEAWLFAAATVAFVLEDALRRLLMAQLRFWRIVVMDASALVGSLLLLAAAAKAGPLTLGSFLAALAVGQAVGMVVGIALQPRAERYVVAFVTGGYREVAGYGSWRAMQQAVRPALLTCVRTLVFVMLGLAATGQLEAARIYVSPTLLFVSGLSSFLFASFASARDVRLAALLRRADHGVYTLLAATVVIGGASILMLPLLGKVITGDALDVWTVVGWVAYSASVAAVTPYGALAAVRGRQAAVLGLRVADSALSLLLAALLLAGGASVAFTPLALAGGSLLGGLAIRWFLLRRPASDSRDTGHAEPTHTQRKAAHTEPTPRSPKSRQPRTEQQAGPGPARILESKVRVHV